MLGRCTGGKPLLFWSNKSRGGAGTGWARAGHGLGLLSSTQPPGSQKHASVSPTRPPPPDSAISSRVHASVRSSSQLSGFYLSGTNHGQLSEPDGDGDGAEDIAQGMWDREVVHARFLSTQSRQKHVLETV